MISRLSFLDFRRQVIHGGFGEHYAKYFQPLIDADIFRLVLNHKNLPYETVWVEGQDIAKTCIAAGIPPLETRPDGSPRYTLPGLADLTKPEFPVLLTDSRKIINYLEATYPSPNPEHALFPHGTHAFQALADNYFERLITPLATPLLIYQMAQKQTEQVRLAFERYAPSGKTLAEAHLVDKEREEAWCKLRDELDKLGAFAEGELFFSGDRLRYFDICLLAAFTSTRLSIGDEEFEKELGPSAGGRWVKLVKARADLIR